MPDPLEILRGADVPVAPDRQFAVRLRERLERALALPRGVTVSDLSVSSATTHAAPPPAVGASALTPYLAVAGAGRALEWYAEVLGARVDGEPIVMPDGRIGHAELSLPDGARLMLADEHPEIGFAAPVAGAGVTVMLHLDVADVDVTIERAVAAGADLERAAADYDYGRNGVIRDPFGHRWMFSGARADGGQRHGDIGYVSLWVDDAEETAALLASVLGWRYAPAPAGHARQVVGQRLHHGILGGVEDPTLFCCFAVAALDAALERVLAAGGAHREPDDEPYGRVAMCDDDQGTAFALYQPPGGVAAAGRPAAALRPGDLAYVTMEVVDSRQARDFYGAVLGWRFAAGTVEDGWQVEDVEPPVGIAGGAATATSVPVYAVADLDDALGRVRAGGGTAGDVEAHPYGRTAACRDGRGTRFVLLAAR